MNLNQRSLLVPGLKWWVALVVLLLAAGMLRYTGYNFSLPYIDHVDEASYNIAAQMIIDSGSARPLGMHGYPPGIVYVNYVLLNLFHDPTTPPGTILWMVRLISVTFSMGTIVAIALLGFRIASPLTGLLAAAAWTFNPTVVEFSRYGTADNFVTFFVIFGLYLLITGVQFNREGWIYSALIASIFSILFKYQAIFVLPIFFLFPLWRLTNPDIQKSKVLMNFLRSFIIVALFGFWLVFLFPALEATSSPDWSAPTSDLTLPTPQAFINNTGIFYPLIANDLLWLLGWAGLFLVVALRFARRHVNMIGIAVLALSLVFWVLGMSLYGSLNIQQFRQFVSAAAILQLLQSAGLTGLLFLIDSTLKPRLKNRLSDFRYANAAVVIAFLVLFIAVNIPDLQTSRFNAYEHTLPDRRNDLAQWMDVSLPEGTYISETENHKTFNREWGGYSGSNRFELYEVVNFETRPVEEWRELGIDYAIVSQYIYREMQNSEEGLAQLAQTTLLKSYPESDQFRGPNMVVLHMYPMANSSLGQLGPILFAGYDLSDASARPGETLTFHYYWQASQPTDSTYAVFNHLIDPESGEIVAQVDGDPLDPRRPTSTWNDPAEIIIGSVFSLTLPEDLPEGTYELVTGFYDRNTGIRLADESGSDRLTVATIVVE